MFSKCFVSQFCQSTLRFSKSFLPAAFRIQFFKYPIRQCILALNGKLRHGGHPVLAWNASNAIATNDPAGGRKLDKSKATGRIDGLVSLAMACSALAMGDPDGGEFVSVYETPGFFI